MHRRRSFRPPNLGSDIQLPAGWKQPKQVSSDDGYAWFVCRFDAPATWRGRTLKVYAEASDDAREIFVNRQRVGGFGVFPPNFRSGLGKESVFTAPNSAWSPGQTNVVAVRLFQREARERFNVAPLLVMAGDEAMRLEGKWRWRPGDATIADILESDAARQATLFRERRNADTAYAQRRRLPNDPGPLTAAQSLAKLKTPDDIEVELALADPDIGQPLQIKFDGRGRMWVVEYLQYPDPAGLNMVSRDKFLRTVYDKTPLPPPNHDRGRDRISVHEDRDGDGYYEHHRIVVDGLNMATSIAIGSDGLYVLNPPYLLRYNDADQDDRIDGAPEVLLEGFGLEDSHSLANSLRWGPDGWLYAAQGSTVTGAVRRYGSKEPPTRSLGQLIWRYHPQTRQYEIFAEGGGNTFGVEIDRHGRIYSGHNGGNTRGFHYVQGGYFQKGFGKHGELSNPFAYGYFPPMQHHAAARFSHTFLVYESEQLPPSYRGVLLGAEPLQGRVIMSRVERDRSSYRTQDIGFLLQSDDAWFRPVEIREGPDGAVYVADFYEQRIDHASHYQGRIHRTSGRVYRIRSRGQRPARRASVQSMATRELIAELGQGPRARRQLAAQQLAQRTLTASDLQQLRSMLLDPDGDPAAALEALWALYRGGAWNDALAVQGLAHHVASVRTWAVRLLGDPKQPLEAKLLESVVALCRVETDVQTRSQLASTAARLPTPQALSMLDALSQRDEDASDIHIPLLLWWALERQFTSDRQAALTWLARHDILERPLVREFFAERAARRLAEEGTRTGLEQLARLLEAAPEDVAKSKLLTGFEQAYQGRPLVGAPAALQRQLARWGGGSLTLRLRSGDDEALGQALAQLKSGSGTVSERVSLARTLGELRVESSVALLLDVATSKEEALQAAALASLQSFSEPKIATRVLQQLMDFGPDAREAAFSLLASRADWAGTLVEAAERDASFKAAVPKHVLARLLLHKNAALNQRIESVWGSDWQGDGNQVEPERVETVLAAIEQGSGNPYRGKQLYATSCGKCHQLFRQGGRVGPDLTPFQRSDIRRLLVNVLSPSLEIREGFETYVIQTIDGRTLSGFISDQDTQVVSLRGVDGQTMTISRDTIDEMFAVKRSVMPTGLLDSMNEQDLRDLFAYLRASQPLPR